MIVQMPDRDENGCFIKGGNLRHPPFGGFKTRFKKGHPDLVSKSKRGHTAETKKKIDLASKGRKPWNYIEDRTRVKLDTERGGPLHKEWSKNIKKRDGWKCRISTLECFGKIVAHHILSWAIFPELRYEINNGITLCHFHHPRKRNDEMKLSLYFQKLVRVKAN